MVAGRRLGRPWFPKLSALVVAVVFGATGASVVAQASPTTLNWGQVATAQAPPARLFGAMTFDSFRNRTVLFGGGNAAFVNLNDTWEFDGANWVQPNPSTSPPALVGSAMAFDINKKVSVMFGGTAPAGASSDTWEWDGTNWNLGVLATKPSARFWSTMAYDSARGLIVLFGGEGSGSTDLGDTWVYDGLSWTRMTPASSPSPRFAAAMAYDPGLGRVVLFGGRVAGQRVADTWEWDGNNWTQFTPSSTPFPRFWDSMAFDPQVGHVVMFGGDHLEPFSLGATNDTWEWDGTQWTQDWTSVTPSARSGQTMALDANGRIVLFGGSDGGNPGVFATNTLELGTGIVTPPGNAAVTFNPTSLDFGQWNVGTTSSAGHVLIYNTGTGPLLTTISTTGDFAVSSTYCPITPNPLAAGMICFVFVTFTPTAGGDRFGSLVLTDNGPGGSQSLALHGTGLTSDFSISASATNLGALQGTSVSTTISTTVIGVPSTIALSFTSTDPGLTATFNPSSITAGGSSVMTIVVGPTVPVGPQALDAGGTEGLAFHRVTIFVNVRAAPTDFSITSNPSSLTMVQGDIATSTISTALLTGPNASIFLDASISAGGLIITISPQTVNTGGSATLTMTSGTFTPPGTYTVTVKGILGSTTHIATVSVIIVAAPPTDFSIAASPSTITVVQGTGATSAISTAVTNGPAATVTLSASVPGVLNATLSPTSITAGGGSTLTVFALATTPPGTYSATVTGVEGSSTHSVVVTVNVTAAPSDFSISASPTTVSVVQGAGATSSITTAVTSGAAATVSLLATAPAGLTATLSPTSVTAGGGSTLTVTASPIVPPGAYTVTVTGVEGSATHSVSVTVNVAAAPSDFSMSAGPTSLTLVQGTSGTSSIATALVTGTADAINLTAASSPIGLAATLNPTVVNAGGTSTLTVSPGFATAPGTYTVTVTGVEGSATHSTSVTVTVTQAPADFSISASPSTLSVVQGSSGTSSITTAVVGAPGTIDLSALAAPAGLTATLSPTSISAGGSATLTVSAAYGTPAGTYTVTVTGTEGSTAHSTTVAVTVSLKGIVNGGFETGDFTGWTVAGKTAIVKNAHTGTFAARVGSPTPSTTSTLAQTFSVPAAGGKLSLWYRMTCPDKVKNDWFTVTLHDNASGTTSTLLVRVCATTGWTHVTANVLAHAGHSVTLTFLNHDDNQQGDASFTLVDDVTLT